jgi:hypothetical protein
LADKSQSRFDDLPDQLTARRLFAGELEVSRRAQHFVHLVDEPRGNT